jgi:hypothetical protein
VRVTDLDTLLALGSTPPEGSGVVGCGFARDGSALFSVCVCIYVPGLCVKMCICVVYTRTRTHAHTHTHIHIHIDICLYTHTRGVSR